MKNRSKKIIAISLGICVFALWFVLLFLWTRPYTEKIVIWLPDNYRLENIISNEVVSIMPTPIDNPYQSDKVFYSSIGIASFKRLFGDSRTMVSVKIEDHCDSDCGGYQIIYQAKVDYADKSLIIVAQEYHYNKKTLSEMRIRDRELFLKNKRDTNLMYFLTSAGSVVIAGLVFLYTDRLNMWSKRDN